MISAPLPDTLNVLGASKVIYVLRFTQPAPLPGSLARSSTRRSTTALLAAAITVIRFE